MTNCFKNGKPKKKGYPCATCGQNIDGHKSQKGKKFCSAKCRQQGRQPNSNRKPRTTVNCCVCKKAIERLITESTKANSFCCGLECQRQWAFFVNDSKRLFVTDYDNRKSRCLDKQVEKQRLRARRRIDSTVKRLLRRFAASIKKRNLPPRNCVKCGDELTETRTRFCSKKCNNRYKRKVRRARIAKAETSEAVIEHEVFKRDNNRCWICQKKVVFTANNRNPRQAVLDHVIPIARGGKHESLNLACCCRKCNSVKHVKITTLF